MPETPNRSINFYALDGDKIGSIIDAYIIKGEIEDLSRFSTKVVTALEDIAKTVEQKNGSVVFCGGDSILFQGFFDHAQCEEILNLFRHLTGRSASMGVGRTTTEAYLALKLAKAQGGGSVIYYPSSNQHN